VSAGDRSRSWRLPALAFAAAMVAMLVGPVTGSMPAGEARAAGPDLTVVGDATYTVLPAARRVHVVIDLVARNLRTETRTKKFFFDRTFLAVLPGTTNFRVTGWPGSRVRVTRHTKSYTMLGIDFGSKLFSGKTHGLQLAFDLPDPGRDANREVRIGPSLVTFPVWAFASDGARGSTVSVRFPKGYDVAVESGAFDRKSHAADGGTILETDPLANPLSFFAFVSGQQPAVYRDTPLSVDAGGQAIGLTMRAWQDDKGWPDRVGPLFTGALPILREEIGLDWPYSGPVAVQEAVSRSDGGYAGLFDGDKGAIQVAYWAQRLVVLHEAAHGWFNGRLLADRWADEGFASLYAARAATALEVKGSSPALTDAVRAAAIPLNAWGNGPAVARATETYGFAASFALAQAIAQRAGDPALRRVWADAARGIGAYQPATGPAGAQGSAGAPGPAASVAPSAAAMPETVSGPPDWRGLLDLLEAETGQAFTDLWRTWVIREDQAPLLDARASALTAYTRTLALADGWTLPRAIRDALRSWQFDTAQQLMGDARTVLAQRVALEQLATRAGLVLPPAMRERFEAGSMGDASTEAEAVRNAMLVIGQAAAARTAEDDILSRIGMIGESPDADLQAAKEAFGAGRLNRSLEAANSAYRAWSGAWQEGRRRALLLVAVLATILVLGSAVTGRSRRAGRSRRPGLRPPLIAALLAMSLATGAAVAPPAADRALPFLAGADAPAALAADTIEIATATRYVVDPRHALVRVTVDVTARNNKRDLTRGGIVKRYFFDGVNLAVQPEAARLRATQGGSPLGVTSVARNGYRLVTVLFRSNIFYQQTAHVTLTFDLPAGKPRSASDVRVGPAFATFLAWAFGDQGTVRIEVPRDFDVTMSGDPIERQATDGDVQVWTATTAAALTWYVSVNARNDAGLTRQPIELTGGEQVLVRGWPEDPRWRDRVTSLLRDSVPQLVTRIGLPWPVDGALSVIEIHTPLLEGYAGFYDPAHDEITISEDLDDVTIVHEASHAWFNDRLFTERWINEGLADEYAWRVLGALSLKPPKPPSVAPGARAAFPLNEWAPPAPIRDPAADARERYGYDASWLAVRSIVQAAGEDGMRRVFGAAKAGTTAYAGDGPAEGTRIPNDWRRFLDLAQELGGVEDAPQLIATWAATPDEAAMLADRTAARRDYAALVDEGNGWAAPEVIRLALDAWSFKPAQTAMGRAQAILRERDETASTAAAIGLTPPAKLERRYEDASTSVELDAARALADETLATLREVGAAGVAAAAPRDWLAELGLAGEDPDALLATARADWEAGTLDDAAKAADAVSQAIATAPGTGRTRAADIGLGLALALGLLALAVIAVRRRARAARMRLASVGDAGMREVVDADETTWSVEAGAGAPAPPGTTTWGVEAGAERPEPYATLPASVPPGPEPGAPPARDEGAEPS
jgi:hypothetical protein